jgi:putative peptidoglycan lipid II flippase
LRRRDIYTPRPGWPVFILKLGIAVYVMGATVWLASGPDAAWLAMGAAARAAHLAGVVAAGVTSYFAALWLLGFRPADFSKKGVE